MRSAPAWPRSSASTGVVTEQVDGHNGRIKLRGEVWSARTYDPSHVIEAGKHVEVVQIDGATADRL